MNKQLFQALVALAGVFFTVYFCATILPALIENPDISSAFAAGYVNPYAAG